MSEKLIDVFSGNLRTLMSTNGYNQADMARHMNISSATASDWYNGIKMPRIEKLEKLSYWLNVEPYKLFKKGGERMLQISLAAARVNANLTQRDVCEKMGVTQNTIINWENGRSEPTISQGRKLSKLYNIPLDNIFLPEKSN